MWKQSFCDLLINYQLDASLSFLPTLYVLHDEPFPKLTEILNKNYKIYWFRIVTIIKMFRLLIIFNLNSNSNHCFAISNNTRVQFIVIVIFRSYVGSR